jgi:hypothetical protein
MATDKHTEANRLGKQKNTDPKSAEGRGIVRPIGLRHGLGASRFMLPGESEADFQSLLDSYEAEHKPTTATEKALVSELATATWRLRRLYRIEAGLYKLKAAKPDNSGPLGLVADGNDKALTILARQEARLERSFYKALRELQRLRTRRSPKVATQAQKAPAQPEAPQQRPQLVKRVPDVPVPIMSNIPRS